MFTKEFIQQEADRRYHIEHPYDTGTAFQNMAFYQGAVWMQEQNESVYQNEMGKMVHKINELQSDLAIIVQLVNA